jgi:hypothetical protein
MVNKFDIDLTFLSHMGKFDLELVIWGEFILCLFERNLKFQLNSISIFIIWGYGIFYSIENAYHIMQHRILCYWMQWHMIPIFKVILDRLLILAFNFDCLAKMY